MQIHKVRVESNIQIAENTFLLKTSAHHLASEILPGQFCNIKVSDSLLRRPFSVCDVEDESVYFMYDVHGEGTKILAEKSEDDELDILGPLGNGFNMDGDYDAAVIVAGGIGVAPFPFFTRTLSNDKGMISFVGARNKKGLVRFGLKNVHVSTDDGSEGFKGTVIDLFEREKQLYTDKKIKVFGCGPSPMLKSLREFCLQNEYECEVSTESVMACGFGICQGCPIQSTSKDQYHLICKDGPVFNIKDIVL